MTVTISGTSGIVNDATDLNYTGTLTGGTGVVNLGSGQVYKDASGNVGIGTASPTERLGILSALTGTTVGSNTVARLQTNGNGYDAHLAMGDNVNASTRLGYLSGAMYFWTNGAERARIDSSGNLGVGTASAYAAVAVRIGTNTNNSTASGGIGLTGGATAQIDLGHGTAASSGASYERFIYEGSVIGSITQNGTTGVSYNTSSDYRLKEAIAPMTGALAKVAALRPCTYKWKVDGSDGQGFIAHELAEVEAGCVTGEKDAVDADGNPQYQGIDTSFLVATLTAAIQEQQTLIVSLQDTLTALTARITALEAQIV